MRYSVSFVFVLAVVASPLSVNAQDSEPASEEPALQLQVDDELGIAVVPRPPRTADGYTLEEMELR